MLATQVVVQDLAWTTATLVVNRAMLLMAAAVEITDTTAETDAPTAVEEAVAVAQEITQETQGAVQAALGE
jgi:transcription termination factor NusB